LRGLLLAVCLMGLQITSVDLIAGQVPGPVMDVNMRAAAIRGASSTWPAWAGTLRLTSTCMR